MNAFQIRNNNPFYGNGIHVLLQREKDIYIYIYIYITHIFFKHSFLVYNEVLKYLDT